MSEKCQCDLSSGWCPLFQQNMSKRQKQICHGVNCTPVITAEYRRAWESEARENGSDNASAAGKVTEGISTTKSPIKPRQPVIRVGSILKEVIYKHTGVRSKISNSEGCGCDKYADMMNSWGIEKCEANIEKIVSHLVSNKTKLEDAKPHIKLLSKLPIPNVITEAVCRSWVREAIDLAKQELSTQDQNYSMFRNMPGGEGGSLTPLPFTAKPSAKLLFHLWPRTGTWQKHIEYLGKYANGYDRKIMAIATGEGTDSVESIQREFSNEWEFVICDNDPKLREVKTYREMFTMVVSQNINDVVVCAHGKGAQSHTNESESIAWWTEAMYETVVGNLPEVFSKMSEGYTAVGSFLRNGKHFGCKYRYHFSGTFYALRTSMICNGGEFPKIRSQWWGTESFPGDHIPKDKAYCIFADDCGDMYHAENQPRNELIEWRSRRESSEKSISEKT